jgi:hypothetical protein
MEPFSLLTAAGLAVKAAIAHAVTPAVVAAKTTAAHAALAHPVGATVAHDAAVATHAATTAYHGVTGAVVTSHSGPLTSHLVNTTISTAHSQGLVEAAKTAAETLVTIGAAAGLAMSAESLANSLSKRDVPKAIEAGGKLALGILGFRHIELPPDLS